MKRLSLIFGLIGFALLNCGAVIVARGPVATGSAAPTYLISEDFEGTGTAAGWSDTNSPNWDYSASPLVGSQSLRVAPSSTTCGSRYTLGVGQSTVNVFFAIKLNTAASFTNLFYLTNASFGNPLILRTNSGSWQLIDAPSGVTATGPAYSTGTLYYVWVDWTTGSGSNATAHLYVSTTTTKPGSPDATFTNGTATGNIDKFDLADLDHSTTNDIVYDKVRVDDVTIGSNPS